MCIIHIYTEQKSYSRFVTRRLAWWSFSSIATASAFADSPSCSMGDLVLSSFLQVLFQTVSNLLQEEVKLERGLGEESRKLISNVSMIEAVLCEAEERQHQERSLRLWLKDLRGFAYDAVDALEELVYETQRRQEVSLAQVRQALSLVNPKRIIFRHNMSTKIQDISKRLEVLKSTAEAFGLIRVHDGGRRQEEGDDFSMSTSLHPPSVYGRERDKRVILEMLLRVESGVSTIAILGECGIGKTTLAQLIYNDKDVETLFELRSWVDVSHDFSIKRLTKAIIESTDSPAPNHILNMDNLQKLLQKKLTGRKFLLVLDNVWNEKPEEWTKFCLPLLRGAEGSKIIVTTRSREVAIIVGSKSPYKLKRLSDDECWSLFCEHAVGRKLYRHSDMADTAKEILNRCKGLPLLAISIGNQMSKENDRRKWISILRSNKQDISGYDNDFVRAIRLSYQQLPAYIKPCFAYCATVPKGFEFEKEVMVHFWMALNLIPLPQGQCAEEIGSNYFDFLVRRSLFERSVYNDKRGKHRYRMPEVVHELAQLVSGDECSILEIGMPCGENTRHLSLIYKQCESNGATPRSATKADIFEKIYQRNGLHSLILLGGSRAYDLNVPDKLASQLARLRILDLSNCGLKLLPEWLGDLKHLRCLQLRDTNISRLPDSLGRLYNLQTLGLRNCYYLEELPKGTKNLHKLRHLDLQLDQDPSQFVSRLRSMPPEIGLLTDLVILTRFVIGAAAGCGLGELKDLNRLQGELIISNLHLVRNAVEAKEANLASKIHIHNLQLQWASKSSTRQVRNDESILNNLKPHENLEELSLVGYSDPSFPSWLSDSTFSNLSIIRLANCNDCESLPQLGCLPMLHELEIRKMNKVKVVNCKFFCKGDGTSPNFPNLEKLVFDHMPSFGGWHGDEGCSLPSLSHIEIKDCTVLHQIAHNLPSLSELKIEGCPGLIGLRRFPRLASLEVAKSGGWIFNSWPCLTALSSLTLSWLPMKYFPSGACSPYDSLRRLEISHCDQLAALPDNWLPLGLIYLTIKHCPRLQALPVGLESLEALTDLNIEQCDQLRCLPELVNLTSLVNLEISHCPQLLHLPRNGVPITLKFLKINSCPLLKQESQNEDGQDWPKLANVIYMMIDEQVVISRNKLASSS